MLHYSFTLFVAGNGLNTRRARQNLDNLCKTYIKHDYEIKVVDVNDNFQDALDKGVIVTPTLLTYPSENINNMIIGDLSDTKTVLETLGINDYNNQ